MKLKIMVCAGVLAATSAHAQNVNAPNPVANFGTSNTSSATEAQQRVSGIDAALTFEASQPLDYTKTTLRTTPDVVAPSIVGGNPCVISASLGGSIVGFGIAGGVGIEDADCETRQTSALLANMGDKGMALMHLCLQNKEVSSTVTAAGYSSCRDYADAAVGVASAGSIETDRGVPMASNSPGAAAVAAPREVPLSTGPLVVTPASGPACTESELRGLKRSGTTWSDYRPECKALNLSKG